jgi:hypothetical protein
MADRRVHAVLANGWEIVRYDRAGKWFREQDGKRSAITFREAVNYARLAGGRVFYGVPGGKRFDAAMRQGDDGG